MRLAKNLIGITCGLIAESILYNNIKNNNVKIITIKAKVKQPKEEVIYCFISTPMSEKKHEEILNNISIAKKNAENIIKKDNPNVKVKFIDSYIPDDKDNPASLLGKAIYKLGKCDYVYFTKEWANSRGCNIEHEVAVKYNKKILYQN